MNYFPCCRVIHIVKSQTIGGSIISSLRLAQAEQSIGQKPEVWIWLKKNSKISMS
jgi:hypothetical protein